VLPIQDARNTVGNIPLSWYDDYPHIGYDLDGTKIMKPAKGDEVMDVFIVNAKECISVARFEDILCDLWGWLLNFKFKMKYSMFNSF